MSENYIKIEVASYAQNISSVRLGVASFLSNFNICVDELLDIKTALSEAITNAIDHAYEDDKKGKIEVLSYIQDRDKIVIIVKDFGSGIEDISLAMTPTYTTKPENEHAGMGFTIMETFMDEVIVDSKIGEGTTITLIRKIRKLKNSKV